MRAFLLVDLGFGDAGKGLLTDFLVRRTGARVVVRYNGGAQAGHNVVTPEGRHHTFSQFGSGTFVPGVRTYLSRHVAIHPTALSREAAALRSQGVDDALARLRISEEALVITPFHQAAGRLRELARGGARHGTCGIGHGEAVGDALARPDEALRAGDLRDPFRLRRLLRRLQERKQEEVAAFAEAASSAGDAAAPELALLADGELIDRWLAAIAPLRTLGAIASDADLPNWLASAGTVVFEGAQGVLLDEWAGFHPHTTWSRCTLDNAMEILAAAAPAAEIQRIGVLRSHAVRHGPGPFPTETAEPRPAVLDHNRFGVWQGAVRYGWFDAVLARYAVSVAGPLDAIALTHLDAPPRLERWQVCAGYRLPPGAESSDLVGMRDAGGCATRLAVPTASCLVRQSRLTALVSAVQPVLADCAPTAAAVIRCTEDLLGQPLKFLSCGPKATDVFEPEVTTRCRRILRRRTARESRPQDL